MFKKKKLKIEFIDNVIINKESFDAPIFIECYINGVLFQRSPFYNSLRERELNRNKFEQECLKAFKA